MDNEIFLDKIYASLYAKLQNDFKRICLLDGRIEYSIEKLDVSFAPIVQSDKSVKLVAKMELKTDKFIQTIDITTTIDYDKH